MSGLTNTTDRTLATRAADQISTHWQATNEAAEHDAALAISCKITVGGAAFPTGTKIRLDGVEAAIPVGLRKIVRPLPDLPTMPDLLDGMFMPMTLEEMIEFLGVSEEELTVFIGQQFGWRLETRRGDTPFTVPSQRWNPSDEQEAQLR